MPNPNEVISKVLHERITAHGPILIDEVDEIAAAIVLAIREAWAADPPQPPSRPKKTRAPSPEAADAIEQCETILGMCDEMPERGGEFADSVREKTESILAWIEENDHVTEAQQEALGNMQDGLSRWLDR